MESNKIFVAPSLKWSVNLSEFSGIDVSRYLSEQRILTIFLKDKHNAEATYTQNGFLSHSSAKVSVKNRIEIYYYGQGELEKDLEAFREFTKLS